MYILIHKNRVIAGPRDWNRAMFEVALERVKITYRVPRRAPAELPLEIDADTRIAEARLERPAINAKIEHADGPYWDFSEAVAVGTYQVKPNNEEAVRNQLRADTAQERYRREVAGATAEIQGQTVTIDTARGGRDVFVQKYLLMGDSDTVHWKFPEGFFTLTKAELGAVVAAGAAHVEAQFVWEENKIAEIDAAADLAALDAIEIKPPIEPQQPGNPGSE